MTEKQLIDAAKRTLELIEKLADQLVLQGITHDQEVQILASLAPRIYDELLGRERDA